MREERTLKEEREVGEERRKKNKKKMITYYNEVLLIELYYSFCLNFLAIETQM